MAIDINIATPNLQEVTDSGNTTNNDVAFTDNAGILLENTSRLREGTIDSGAGGGIAQICAVGYELKWEAGSQYVMDGNGLLIREVNHKFNIVPDVNNDSTQGYYVGSRWVLDNGDVYICTDSTSTAAVWEIVANADWNATTGSTAIANKPSIPAAQVNSDWNATSGVAEILNKPTIPSVTGFVPYTGATADLDMGTHNLTADHIALNVNPSGAGFVVGSTQWNNTIGSSETLLKGGNVTIKNGVDLVARIVNKVTPNTTLTKASYQAVRVSGAQGGRLAINLAQANNDNNSADTIGLVTETIATNQEGFIITVGQLENINTTGSLQGETWVDGDVLYLSPTTAGRLTNIKPTGAGHIVVIGYVEYAHAINGKIYVKIMNGWELDELHDVAITSVANNDLLQYDSATSLWKNESLSTAGIQPTLVSATNIKTVNGNSLLGSGDLVISGGGGSGIFGISNASGVYTYYATLTLAMAAATSGQTIEMFANVTETGAVTITLKNGVNINGNGYTYTLNNSGLIHAFSAANSVTTSCNILNLNVVRTGSTGSLFDNTCLILGINGSGIINCSGSTFRNSGSGAGIVFNSNSTHEINYATAYATTTWGAIAMFTSSGARLNNSIGYGISGGYGIRCHNGGDIQNCIGYSDSGYGIFGLSGNQSNSVGISATGVGFLSLNNSYNCVGRSISGIGFEITNAVNAVGCVGISVSGIGISANNSLLYSCSGISSSSRGFQITGTSKAYNITSKSTSSYSILSNNPVVEIHNSTIISEWNNAGGIGISSNITTIPATILNSTFLLSNASAPYLFNNTAAQAVSTRGNTYRGGGAYSVLITQAIVTVEDSQGNIFL
jgi:hypothetical protein